MDQNEETCALMNVLIRLDVDGVLLLCLEVLFFTHQTDTEDALRFCRNMNILIHLLFLDLNFFHFELNLFNRPHWEL